MKSLLTAMMREMDGGTTAGIAAAHSDPGIITSTIAIGSITTPAIDTTTLAGTEIKFEVSDMLQLVDSFKDSSAWILKDDKLKSIEP